MKNLISSLTLRTGRSRTLTGVVKAPASKSYTHRALIVASLNGRSRIVNPLFCDDTRNTMSLCVDLGARVREVAAGLLVEGNAGEPRLGRSGVLNVGESGTLLRFSLPLLALAGRQTTIQGRGSLISRTNRQIVDVLRAWGVNIEGRGPEHYLPISIAASGVLRGGRARVDGSVTSQVVSSLLIAAPFAQNDTILRLSRKLVSRPYVDVTIDVLKWAGIHVERDGYKTFTVRAGQAFQPAGDFTVHGDYSSAAFLLAAGALCESDIAVTDLVEDCQGDRRIVTILRSMGAAVRSTRDTISITGPSRLQGVDIDGSDIPDLVPILSVLGCFAKGTTRIRNIGHLVHKESNRLSAPAIELRKLGADIQIKKDELLIRQSRIHGGVVSACNDHRIAMALTVAGLGAQASVTVRGAECMAKSYPGFVSDMLSINANIAAIKTA